MAFESDYFNKEGYHMNEGPAAATIILFVDYNVHRLTLDWSFDGVYFTYYKKNYVTFEIEENNVNISRQLTLKELNVLKKMILYIYNKDKELCKKGNLHKVGNKIGAFDSYDA
jgi:hypothetical protein